MSFLSCIYNFSLFSIKKVRRWNAALHTVFYIRNIRGYLYIVLYTRYHQNEGSENPVLWGHSLSVLLRREACWKVKPSEDQTSTTCISADLYAKNKWLAASLLYHPKNLPARGKLY